MTSSVFILAAALCCLSAFSYAEELNFYKHTFSIPSAISMNLGSNNVDGTLPRKINVTDEQRAGCVGRLDGGTFNGIRGNTVDGSNNNYLYSLYDVNGIISGVQVATPKDQIDTTGFNYAAVPAFQEETRGGIVYKVITVYFVSDPSIICGGGRSDVETTGTATALNLQNGPNPTDLRNAPFDRSAALATGNYSNDNCFPGMGNHTFSAVQTWQTYNCTQIIPIFLLQNAAGELTGFGLAWTGASKSNKTLFEKPDDKVINLIVKNPPKCLVDLAAKNLLTTVHILFTKTPYNCGFGASEVIDKFQNALAKFADGVGQALNQVAHSVGCFFSWRC